MPSLRSLRPSFGGTRFARGRNEREAGPRGLRECRFSRGITREVQTTATEIQSREEESDAAEKIVGIVASR